MAVPIESYMKITGGTSSSNSTIYTSNLIKTGDNIVVSGTANNNGVFTVTDISTDGSDVYYILKGGKINDENSAGSTDPSIQVVRAPGDKLCALGDVDSAGGVDVWSNNATSSYSTKDNGWTASAISPTLSGNDAQYIFHFADEALRVCNINEQCTSHIKWYGFIQRNQFSDNKGLVFSEWQEHPNTLSPPKSSGVFSYGFGHTDHSAGNIARYYNSSTNRGVTIGKEDGVSQLRLQGAVDASSEAFVFENTSDTTVLDQAELSELVTINTAVNAAPTEILFCKKTAGTGSSITYTRSHGGNLLGTAPDSYSDHEGSILTRGIGFNIAVSDGTQTGEWEADTYEFHQTFIYDENQESIPVQVGDGEDTIAAFTHAAGGGKALRVSVFADNYYNGRISGGRIYIRKQNSDDDLTLLADIHIEKGMRTSLDNEYDSWTLDSNNGYYVLGAAVGNSTKPNLDTYDTINGYGPDVKFMSIGRKGELYKASVVAGRRTFIANVKTFGFTGALEKFGDRIMYSEVGRFDTFLPNNFIDVSKGDYGEYTALESFADRLLAFKHNLVHIINIASPSPASWYLEDTVKYYGVTFPFSVSKTEFGIAWANEAGCFLYDGSRVRNLTERKLGVAVSSNNSSGAWYTIGRGSSNIKDPMVGYDPMSNSLIVMRSPGDNSTNSNQAYIYDFDSGGWTYNTSMFTDSANYTNFITDWNNNLTVGQYDGSSDVNFFKYLPVSFASTAQEFRTRDIDFGQPGVRKKIYAVTMTYKSTAEQNTPLYYETDGGQDWDTEFATGSGVLPQGNTGGAGYLESTSGSGAQWGTAVFTPSSPVECNSIAFKLDLPSSGKFEVNDMTVEYRVLRTKAAS
tara:strand:- start:159 stop:2726 length:2568 start_codon:yes stop_codon:yes gene_type:complete